MRCNHHCRTRVECHFDGRQRGTDAGVLGDIAGIVLRHVEISADKDAFVFGLAVGAEIGKADELHGKPWNRGETIAVHYRKQHLVLLPMRHLGCWGIPADRWYGLAPARPQVSWRAYRSLGMMVRATVRDLDMFNPGGRAMMLCGDMGTA